MRAYQGRARVACVRKSAHSALSRRDRTNTRDAQIATMAVKDHITGMTMFSFHMRFLRSAGILLNRR